MNRDEARRLIHEVITIIDHRDYHGWLPKRDLVRLIISKLKDGKQTFRKMRKSERQYLIEQVHKRVEMNLDRDYESLYEGRCWGDE